MIIQHLLFPALVLQKDAASQTTLHHLVINFHWRASAFCIQLTIISDELYYQQMNGEVRARPRRRTGVAGGAGADKGAHEQRGRGHATSPRKGKVAASPCKHKL